MSEDFEQRAQRDLVANPAVQRPGYEVRPDDCPCLRAGGGERWSAQVAPKPRIVDSVFRSRRALEQRELLIGDAAVVDTAPAVGSVLPPTIGVTVDVARRAKVDVWNRPRGNARAALKMWLRSCRMVHSATFAGASAASTAAASGARCIAWSAPSWLPSCRLPASDVGQTATLTLLPSSGASPCKARLLGICCVGRYAPRRAAVRASVSAGHSHQRWSRSSRGPPHHGHCGLSCSPAAWRALAFQMPRHWMAARSAFRLFDSVSRGWPRGASQSPLGGRMLSALLQVA